MTFFANHPWLLRHGPAHQRRVAAQALQFAKARIQWVSRELAETRAALKPKPRALVDGCLSELIRRESGWNHRAQNPSTGAYGLPQALPGSKMASAGADWRTNPVTQIRWMLGYVSKYGGSCAALSFQKAHGWY